MILVLYSNNSYAPTCGSISFADIYSRNDATVIYPFFNWLVRCTIFCSLSLSTLLFRSSCRYDISPLDSLYKSSDFRDSYNFKESMNLKIFVFPVNDLWITEFTDSNEDVVLIFNSATDIVFFAFYK